MFVEFVRNENSLENPDGLLNSCFTDVRKTIKNIKEAFQDLRQFRFFTQELFQILADDVKSCVDQKLP